MTNVVLKAFTDKEDGKRLNEPGQLYPREGLEVTEEREQLLREKEYIVQIADQEAKEANKEDGEEKQEEKNQEFPMHKGGGNYVLSNGESVKGKDAAIEAEEKLKAGE